MTTTVRMLLAAAALMLLAGVIFAIFCACGFTRPCWVRARWACAAAAMNHRGRR